jgi:Flp pilus assembly secretin CpaC
MMKIISLIGLCLVMTIGLATTESYAGSNYIKLEVGKTKPMKISKQPDLVLVGNPGVADIILEENNRIFLVGLTPGQTNLLMYDSAGKLMFSQNIIVTGQKTGHVTVHKGTGQQLLSCTNDACTRVSGGVSQRSAGKAVGAQGGTSGQSPELVGE